MLPSEAAGEPLADPRHAAGELGLPAGVPGLDVSIRDLRERNFLQFRISQKRLGRGVFTLEVFESLDSSPRQGLVTRQPRRRSNGRAHRAFQWPVESKH
jgi:hypothetical protein